MSLKTSELRLFTTADYQNVIGESLDEQLTNKAIGATSTYFITYACVDIESVITEMSGRHLYKVETSPSEFDLYFGYTRECAKKLKDEVKNKIILACVYQADYLISNGSTERMVGVFAGTRSGTVGKETMRAYEISDISRRLLTDSGVLYAGIGCGLDAWIK